MTHEAPLLATPSLLPIDAAFIGTIGIPVETRDISLAGRISVLFPESIKDGQRIPDDLAELGQLATTSQVNIANLPNISPSMPQLQRGQRLGIEGHDHAPNMSVQVHLSLESGHLVQAHV